MFFAERPANRVGGRIWLPFLQMQIATAHFFGAPQWAYRLIPSFYFLLATASLGLLWLRWAGRGASAAWTAGAVTALFAHQTLVHQLGSMMMQEIVGTGLFYLFILGLTLEEKPKPGWVLAPAMLAMLTRDGYRVLLAVAIILHFRHALFTRAGRRWTAWLAAGPAAWQLLLLPLGFYLAEGRLPHFPVEWPLSIKISGTAANLSDSAESLWRGLTEARALGPFIGTALAALLLFAAGRFRRDADANGGWEGKLLGTIGAGVALSYLLIWYFHPWQAQYPDTPRMAWPLIESTFLAAAVIGMHAANAARPVRLAATALMLAGMAAGVERDVGRWFPPDQRAAAETHAELRAWIDDHGGPSICIQSRTPFTSYERWAAALLNREGRNEWSVPEVLSSECGAWLIEAGTASRAPEGWTVERRYEIDGARYALWTP